MIPISSLQAVNAFVGRDRDGTVVLDHSQGPADARNRQ
jgi:hypothetical protein